MPSAPARRSSGLRAAVSHGGGRSSLLRLSTAPRLPSAAALGEWVGRVARPLPLDATAAGHRIA